MEDEELEPVNCAVAVRAIKDAGIFMLLDRDGCHYLVTEEFILQLRKKDAWKIQCKTETERRNVYYVKKKGGWEESPKIANPDAVLVRYESYISQAANRGEPLAATGIIVPLEIDGFSIDGLREVESRVLEARAAGHDVRLTGVLVTKFTSRTKMDREGLQFLRTKTNFPVFHNVIHMSIKVKESVFQHRPVVECARKCRPAQDYRAFVEELVPDLGTEQEGALV